MGLRSMDLSIQTSAQQGEKGHMAYCRDVVIFFYCGQHSEF